MRQYFTTNTRTDATTYVTIRDDAPAWVVDAVRDAHDGELPNDWRYETCAHIAAMIDDGEDDPSNIADSLVDVYNSDLFAWLVGSTQRAVYVDEAREEMGMAGEDLMAQIRTGQFWCVYQMAGVLIDAHREHETGGKS